MLCCDGLYRRNSRNKYHFDLARIYRGASTRRVWCLEHVGLVKLGWLAWPRTSPHDCDWQTYIPVAHDLGSNAARWLYIVCAMQLLRPRWDTWSCARFMYNEIDVDWFDPHLHFIYRVVMRDIFCRNPCAHRPSGPHQPLTERHRTIPEYQHFYVYWCMCTQ